MTSRIILGLRTQNARVTVSASWDFAFLLQETKRKGSHLLHKALVYVGSWCALMALEKWNACFWLVDFVTWEVSVSFAICFSFLPTVFIPVIAPPGLGGGEGGGVFQS